MRTGAPPRRDWFGTVLLALAVGIIIVHPTSKAFSLAWLGELLGFGPKVVEKAPRVTVADILIWLAGAALLLRMLLRRELHLLKALPIPAILLVSLAFVSMLFARNRLTAIADVVQFIEYFILLLLVLTVVFNSRGRLQAAAWLWLAIGLFLGLCGWREYPQTGSPAAGVSATFLNRNILSGYLAMLLPFGWGMILQHNRRSARVLEPILITCPTAAGCESRCLRRRPKTSSTWRQTTPPGVLSLPPRPRPSRSASLRPGYSDRLLWPALIATGLVVILAGGPWIAAAVGILVVTMVYSRKLFPVVLLGLLVLALGVFPLLPRNNTQVLVKSLYPFDEGLKTGIRVENPALVESARLNPRYVEWQAGVKFLTPGYHRELGIPRATHLRQLLLGVGIGNYQTNIGRFYGFLPKPNENTTEPDTQSLYLVMAVSVGIPAVLAFLWLVGTFIRRAAIGYAGSDDPFLRGLLLGCIGSLVSLLITNIFTNTLVHGSGPAMILVFAFAAAGARLAEGKSIAAE